MTPNAVRHISGLSPCLAPLPDLVLQEFDHPYRVEAGAHHAFIVEERWKGMVLAGHSMPTREGSGSGTATVRHWTLTVEGPLMDEQRGTKNQPS